MTLINLTNKAKEIRLKILHMCVEYGGHLASSLSCTDIFISLYYGGFIKYDISNPKDKLRTRFILSKGHAETILYAILSDIGFINNSIIESSYRKNDCFLGSHPDISIPGVEITSGSLGHGLGIGAGMSLANKIDNIDTKCYVLMGDAECLEGSVWEAAIFASHHKLSNLIAIIDRNQIGALQFTNEFTALEPFEKKWESFGWDVYNIDGHCLNSLVKIFRQIDNISSEKPSVIIANTIKGKGISFIENDPSWHVRSLSNPEEIKNAFKELNEK